MVGTGSPVGVEEDALWRAPRCNQRETTWRDAIFEQPLSFAEHQRKDPDAIFVNQVGGDQRLQQFAAAPNMQRRPIRRLQPAELVHDIAAYALRCLPVELVEGARDDVFRRLVERLRNRVVALVRPVAGEDLVGPASQKHVELTGDGLANDLLRGVVHEGHGPTSVGKPVRRILLGATGRLHDAVQRDLGDCNDLSHLSPVFAFRIPRTCVDLAGYAQGDGAEPPLWERGCAPVEDTLIRMDIDAQRQRAVGLQRVVRPV
jgi:hypothetical protein